MGEETKDADIELASGCGYQGYEFGAHYPDSVCLEGYLWDADSGEAAPSGEGWLYSVGGDIPCPQCNHAEWLEYGRDDVETAGYLAADNGKPASPCPYDSIKLRYPEDRETLKAWWLKGHAERLAESPEG